MGNYYRYDAHCHIFTLKYIMKEVKSLLHDILNRTYPWKEPKVDKGLLGATGKWKEIKNLLRQLYEIIRSSSGSEDENLDFLIDEAKKAFPNDSYRIIPLMMDVFYMLAYPLDKDEEPQFIKGLKAASVNEKEFQEAWNDILEDFKGYVQSQNTNLRGSKGDGGDVKFDQVLKIIEEERSVKGTLTLKASALKSADTQGFYHTDGYCYHMDKLMELVGNRNGLLYPFVAIDPRRPGIIDTLLSGSFFTGNKRFYGVKLYPRMGYDPQCKPLGAVYKYCSDNSIPITYHCGMGGFPPGTDWKYTKYGNPDNFEPIIKEYPNLRIDFAHMGSTDDTYTWAGKVDKLINDYDNVYTDLSCYVSTNELDPIMKRFWKDKSKLKTRLMFGTDFDVMYFTGKVTMENYFKNFKSTFTEDELKLIMHDNPTRFLGIKD